MDIDGTDASTVIQAAIDALLNGGKIFIKPGTYSISNKIIGGSAIQFIGEGYSSFLDGTGSAEIFEFDGKNNFTPTEDEVFLCERTTGGALARQTAAPDATNIYITATSAKDYNWKVEKA